MHHKSPFLIVEDFISPMLCEEIVDEVFFTESDTSNSAQFTSMYDTVYEKVIIERIKQITPNIETYYNVEYRGTERVNFEMINTDSFIPAHGENAELISKKWCRTKMRDFTCVLFLSDYNNTPPFDTEFECYGGKLEFVNHKFGFNPIRGVLVCFPSDPRFSNATATVNQGTLHQLRIHIATQKPYIYNPKDYPGDYRVWF